jgi:tRNA(adenine34) deaminase
LIFASVALINHNDEVFMRAAMEQARFAFENGEVPVGAVLVKDGEIIARGYNCPITLNDPTAHAEIQVLRQAGIILKNYRLIDTELYVTIEPCIMCMGALIQARVKRLIYGASDLRAGAAGSVFNFVAHEKLNHAMELTSGILEEPCRDLMHLFFKKKRQTVEL